MHRDRLIRRALAASAVFNLGGAVLFAFPDSPTGRLAGLSGAVPGVYSAMVAWFVLLFAGAYAWLARQPEIDRPLVALGAIGKAGAFSIFAACWILGQLSGRAALAGTGDLIFAAIFAWWLIGSRAGAPAGIVAAASRSQ
jgi:hypothetical protein